MSTICHDVLQDAVQVQEMCGLLDRLDSIPQEIKTESSRIQEFKKLVTENQHVQIIQKLFAETELVLNKGSDTDILNFFAIFTTLILKIAKKGPVILEIVNRLQENIIDKTHVRLQVLIEIFNLDIDLSRKYSTLIAILNYTDKTNQSDSIISQFLLVDEWEKELQLIVEKKREFCLALLQILKNKKQALPILTLYLKSFDNETDIVIESSFETIELLVLNTIKTVDIHHIDILNLRSISTFKDKPLYKLLEIFSIGECKIFREYFSTVNYFSEADFDLLFEKMRMLTLTSIFVSKQQVSFLEVAIALDIAENDVEAWVVDAASRDLIFVRIDQPQKLINVSYSTKRCFDQNDWKVLGNRVANCRENMNTLLETVRRAKQAVRRT